MLPGLPRIGTDADQFGSSAALKRKMKSKRPSWRFVKEVFLEKVTMSLSKNLELVFTETVDTLWNENHGNSQTLMDGFRNRATSLLATYQISTEGAKIMPHRPVTLSQMDWVSQLVNDGKQHKRLSLKKGMMISNAGSSSSWCALPQMRFLCCKGGHQKKSQVQPEKAERAESSFRQLSKHDRHRLNTTKHSFMTTSGALNIHQNANEVPERFEAGYEINYFDQLNHNSIRIIINKLIESLDSWNFDVFEFERCSQGLPLFTLSKLLFEKYELLESFGISVEKFSFFSQAIEVSYPNNLYHNSLHAADVLITVNVLLFEVPVFISCA